MVDTLQFLGGTGTVTGSKFLFRVDDAPLLVDAGLFQGLKKLRLLHDPEFTQDPAQQANLWKPRKGIIASVGAMRAPGTTSLIEDVLFPVPRLADAVTDLQGLFATHGYPEGVIYGHAKDGNLHFQINQSFNTQGEINKFDHCHFCSITSTEPRT